MLEAEDVNATPTLERPEHVYPTPSPGSPEQINLTSNPEQLNPTPSPGSPEEISLTSNSEHLNPTPSPSRTQQVNSTASAGMTEEKVTPVKSQNEIWEEELQKAEQEVALMRHVIISKQKRIADLKKFLGRNLATDIKEKVNKIGDSDVVVQANQAFKNAGEKTTAAFATFGRKLSGVTQRINDKVKSTNQNPKSPDGVNGKQSQVYVTPTTSPLISPSTPSTTLPGRTPEDAALYRDLDDEY